MPGYRSHDNLTTFLGFSLASIDACRREKTFPCKTKFLVILIFPYELQRPISASASARLNCWPFCTQLLSKLLVCNHPFVDQQLRHASIIAQRVLTISSSRLIFSPFSFRRPLSLRSPCRYSSGLPAISRRHVA